MTPRIVLGVVLLVGALSIAIAAQQPQAKVIDVTKLKDNLYVLKGAAGTRRCSSLATATR